jgi:hypothetical protein
MKTICAIACAFTLASGGALGTDASTGTNGLPVVAPAPLLPASSMPSQFDITGFIQEATLDTTGAVCAPSDPRLAGGTLKVNNLTVIVPCNTILQMPAATVSWQELFSLAPRDIGLPLGTNGIPTQTGLALQDNVRLPVATPYNGPLPSYEVRVQGNIVNGRYIAGLIFISQHSLQASQGTIRAIDYDNGEMQVAASQGPNPAIVRVRINDPIGRFGKSHGAPGSGADLTEPGYDPRLSIDTESPTIHALTGFPMCLPRTNPFTQADDPLCPQQNRPRAPNCRSLPVPFPAFVPPAAGQFCTSFMMPPPSQPCAAAAPSCPPDPTRQAPFEVGDVIVFSGTLKVDEKGAYISAHTITANVGIYTTPGTMPTYVVIEALIQGTSALPQLNVLQEATSRVLVEGFSTDPATLVDIYAVDVDPLTGAERDRLLGTAPAGAPVIGRFRFFPNAGAFLPPVRELRVVSRNMCSDFSLPCAMPASARTYANGLIAGQYHAPNFEYVFPEALILGDPVLPANLQDLPFLYCGSGPLGTPTGGDNGPLVRQLDPAPWAPPMTTPLFAATLCAGEPVVGAVAVSTPSTPPAITLFPGATVTASSGGTVLLSASATDATRLPIAIHWVQSGGTRPQGVALIPPAQPNAITFTAPAGPAQMLFTVSATNPNTGLTSTATVTVNVTGTQPDVVRVTRAIWTSVRQNRGALSVAATSNAPLSADGLPPPGLQLYVQATATVAALVPDGTGGLIYRMSEVQLSPSPLPMFFGPTGNPAVCPAGVARCWQFLTRGALVDPNGGGIFVPPDRISVTSSLGGSATATQANGGIQMQ